MKGKKWLLITIAVINVLLIAVVIALWTSADRNGPVIEFSENDAVYHAGMEYAPFYEGVTARDAKDGDVTGRIVVEKVVEDEAAGTATVTYAASDLSGNVTKMSRVFKADYSVADASGAADSGEEQAGNVESAPGEADNAGETDKAAGNDSDNNAASAPDDSSGENAKTDDTGSEDEKEEPRKVTLDDLSEEEQKAIKDEALAEAKAQQERAKQRAEAKAAKAAEQAQKETQAAENSSKPGITLKNTSVKTIPGQTPMWVDAIGGLHDDKDSYAQLFSTLKYTKYDINTAGSYSVGLTVKDSDGNVSDPVYVTVVVK